MGTIAGNKPERVEDLFVAYDVDVGVYATLDLDAVSHSL